MSKKTKSLYQTIVENVDESAVKSLIATHIERIKENLKAAAEAGTGVLVYDFPPDFGIANMDGEHSRLLVVPEIIEYFVRQEGGGFPSESVRYFCRDGRYMLRFTWPAFLCESDVKSRKEYLARYAEN